MQIAQLLDRVSTLHNQRQVCAIGAALIDVVSDVSQLPVRGGDTALGTQQVHIGGCAFNIALALHRLGIDSINALPIGTGMWLEQIQRSMQYKGIQSILSHPQGDNGWCLALVEPDGERIF